MAYTVMEFLMFGIGFIEFIVTVVLAGVLLFGASFFLRIIRGDKKNDKL